MFRLRRAQSSDDTSTPLDETDLLMIERRRRRIVTPLTMLLTVLVVGVLGVVAGASLKDSGSSTAGGLPSGLPGGASGGGAGGLPDFAALGGLGGGAPPSIVGTGAAGANPFGGGGGVTIGTVKLVDGTNLYVQDAAGNITKISTGADVGITVSAPGSLADLEVGQSVTVQGTKGKDGTVAATSISGGAPATTGAG